MTAGVREIEAYAQLVMARLAIDDRASIADHHLVMAMLKLREVFPGIDLDASRLLVTEGLA
jgi:hypothetical protein